MKTAAGCLVLLLDEAYGSDGSPSGQAGKPVIRASRQVNREALTDTTGAISDSIVRRVLESGRPLIVSDALSDDVFPSPSLPRIP